MTVPPTIKKKEPAIFDSPPVLGPETMNCLLYGPAGAGKTTAAASAPGPIIWANLDGPNAMVFARKVAAERGTDLLEIQIAPDEDPRIRLREAITYSTTNDVRTIVVDGVGKLREQIAYAIGGDNPSMQDWGMVGKAMRDLTRALRDLPVNVIFIAHEQIVEEGEAVIIRPEVDAKGRTAEMLMGEVDVVGYCGVIEDEGERIYAAQLVEKGGRRAKDRSGALGTFRQLDLSEWLETFTKALATDLSDIPFLENGEEEEADEDQ